MAAAGSNSGITVVRRRCSQSHAHAVTEQPPPQRVRRIERSHRRCRTPMRDETRSASSRLCVEITIVCPRSRKSSTSSRTRRAVCGSRPEVGSSSRMTGGECSRAVRSRSSASCPWRAARRGCRRGPRGRTSRVPGGPHPPDRRRHASARTSRFSLTVNRSHKPGASVRKPTLDRGARPCARAPAAPRRFVPCPTTG